MESKFAIRRYHGDRPGWINCEMRELEDGFYRELGELEYALESGDEDDIRWESVDVANRALMIADKVGLLEYVENECSE